MSSFPHLFSPMRMGQVEIPNRIVSTGHHTYLADGAPSPELIAYHKARAEGGAGLIVTEIVAAHESAGFSSQLLRTDRRGAKAYAELARTVHQAGARIFSQLFHPGREIMRTADGMAAVAFAPSAIPNERFHVMPREMPDELIHEIISGFADAAMMMADAGFDGVEIVGSHGYLPAQFLNPATNLRQDRWGGDFDRRLCFVRQVARSIRAAAPNLVVGLRLSGDEKDGLGMGSAAMVDVCAALGRDLDYLSVTAGTSASLGASVHITPPMGERHGYLAPLSRAIRDAVDIPVIVTGRINQPQIAEAIIADGAADMCGMTRAMICDPDMGAKARNGKPDDIRACIGCNQACIGRAHKGLGISCIQYPESGRETTFSTPSIAALAKQVIVVGGGPGGMKAAAIAAGRGHEVTLLEAAPRLGGQALLAQKLPGREEFGGLIDNLAREMNAAGVRVKLGRAAGATSILPMQPDAVILATGAKPYTPVLELSEEAHVLNAWDVLHGANTGSRVVIADWKADWIGLGLAEKLATSGANVTLAVNAAMAGESLQLYTRNHYVGRLHRLGVSIRTHLRLFGADESTVYFQDVLTGEPVMVEDYDTLVTALGHSSEDALLTELADAPFEVTLIGDALAPRTAEEAIFEGLEAGWNI